MSKVLLVSRCAWTLYNFRKGQMEALRRKGYTVIGGGAGGDGFEPKIESLGVPFVGLPVNKRAVNPVSDLILIWSLYRWYRRERPEVVHHFTIKPVIYGSIAARLAGVPRIVNTVTGLGYVFTGDKITWLRRLVEAQYRVALKCAHFTFFQNEDDRSLFVQRRLIRREHTGLVPGSGVNTSAFQPCAAQFEDVRAKPFTFLMVARLLRDKGVYEYVEAARQVRAEFPNSRFQLLGARDERNPTAVTQEEVETWIAEKTIEWLGEVADVRPMLSEADVVALPSYREGTPRSLLEAAAMGKPLITTDVVGCRNVVEDGVNGILVPVKDADALARAMRRMIHDDSMRRRMGAAGREKIVREFDEAIVIARVVDIYNKETL